MTDQELPELFELSGNYNGVRVEVGVRSTLDPYDAALALIAMMGNTQNMAGLLDGLDPERFRDDMGYDYEIEEDEYEDD